MAMTESRMQNWRAIGITKSGIEYVIFVGMSYEKIRTNYVEAFNDILTLEEQLDICTIAIQRWTGMPDHGKWVSQGTLKTPNVKEGKNDLLQSL